jgi:hypothetical protein
MLKFAEYVEQEENAGRFNGILFDIRSNIATDTESLQRFDCLFYQRYSGTIRIECGKWLPTEQKTCSNTTNLLFSLFQLYAGIKALDLEMAQPEHDDQSFSIRYKLKFENLSRLQLEAPKRNELISKLYWNYANKILENCPNVRTVNICLNENSIKDPIDLRLKPIGENVVIDVTICDAIFIDNTLDTILIGEAKTINLKFKQCRFELSRLLLLTTYVDKHEDQFAKIGLYSTNDESMVPMKLEESVVKEIYQNKFRQDFNFEVQFDTNSSIPMKRYKIRLDQSDEYFELINEALKENRILVITGYTLLYFIKQYMYHILTHFT